MQWYAAHIIMYVKFKEEKQERYPIWENVVLIKAQTVDNARKKATKVGKEGEGDSLGTFKWDRKPATWVFAGIRKLIECEPPLKQSFEKSSNNILSDGTEITYSQLEVDSKEALLKLVKGEPVTVLYEE